MNNLKEKILFKEIGEEWLYLKKISVKYSTYTKYEGILTIHIMPTFGKLSVEDITEDLIMEYFHEHINNDSLSISMLATIRYILKSILEHAQVKYGITSANFKYIKLRKPRTNVTALTTQQQSSLEEYCFNHYDSISLAVLLSLYGGFRVGEVAGLRWDDIKIKTGIVEVKRTIERLKSSQLGDNKTELMILDPKTKTSKRFVPLPDFILDYIKQYYETKELKDLDNYIYTGSNKIPDPRRIQAHFHRLCKKCGFITNYHTLRHTYATNCVKNDIDVKSLSEMLGHSNVAITLELYVHTTLEFKIDQVNKLKKSKQA